MSNSLRYHLIQVSSASWMIGSPLPGRATAAANVIYLEAAFVVPHIQLQERQEHQEGRKSQESQEDQEGQEDQETPPPCR